MTKPVAIGDHDMDGTSDLMVKFDRQLVQQLLAAGDNVRIVISGTVNGVKFEGVDYIKVIK